MLTGKNLIKNIGGRPILNGVDISIEPGKITSVIGPSGAGKTTLLRVLSLLDFPDSGEISWEEYKNNFPLPVGKVLTPRWPLVSVVFQQLFIWPHLTLRENILLPLGKEINQESKAQFKELTELFDMNQFLDRYSNESSLGQRQRTAIVRALMLNPKYLLLDEITSSLDVEQIALILKHLKDVKNKGVGILLVTHLINFAEQVSDSIIFLDEGRVVEFGGVEILKNPKEERVAKFLSLVKLAS